MGRRGGAARRGEGGHLAPGPHPSPSGGNQNPVAGLLRSRDFWKGQNPARSPAMLPPIRQTRGRQEGKAGRLAGLFQSTPHEGATSGSIKRGRAGIKPDSPAPDRRALRGTGRGQSDQGELDQGNRAGGPRSGASRAGCNAKSYRASRARWNRAGWKRHHALPQARAAPAPRRGLQSERITASKAT